MTDPLQEAIQARDARTLCKVLLGIDLTPGQARIAEVAAWGHPRRSCVAAHTRYGKTYAIAAGVCLGILLRPGNPKSWVIIAPTLAQSRIMRSYIADIVIENQWLGKLLDLEQSVDVDRLRREVSRTRMTFKDGQQLRILSAEGSAERLMGYGADRLIVDEAALIQDEVYRTRILRMLGDSPDSSLLLATNPWHGEGFFGQAWADDRYVNLHISWKEGLREGRITQEIVDEARHHLSMAEFQVLYEARFPDTAEDQLISWAWLRRAQDPNPAPSEGKPVYGLDVAEGGGDECVLTPVVSLKGHVHAHPQIAWRDADTMATGSRVKARVPPGAVIAVDATGVGKGVSDWLREEGFQVHELKVGRKSRHPERFVNLNSEVWWNLRTLFEDEAITLHGDTEALVKDLARMRYDTGTGRVRVHVEGGKTSGNSPDRGDSLAYACHRVNASSVTSIRTVPRREVLL